MGAALPEHQLEAERSHVLVAIVEELGGLAHHDMTAGELDTIVDNMLSKGVPSTPSTDLQRWIHRHRNRRGFKIAQILGAHVNKASSIIPECFGKFHDPAAVECKACLDRTLCAIKSKQGKDAIADTAEYPVSAANTQTILTVLQGKNGQIAKTLSRGSRVVLEIHANKLKVLATDSPNQEGEALNEDNMATGKGKPATKPAAAAVVEEEEVDLTLAGVEEEEVETKGEVEEVEEVEEAAPAPKAKKEPKPKPVLNKAQQDFQAELDKHTGEDKQKYSAAVAKKLGIKAVEKGDARIDHMLRTMAIKKHLGTAKPAAKK